MNIIQPITHILVVTDGFYASMNYRSPELFKTILSLNPGYISKDFE